MSFLDKFHAKKLGLSLEDFLIYNKNKNIISIDDFKVFLKFNNIMDINRFIKLNDYYKQKVFSVSFTPENLPIIEEEIERHERVIAAMEKGLSIEDSMIYIEFKKGFSIERFKKLLDARNRGIITHPITPSNLNLIENEIEFDKRYNLALDKKYSQKKAYKWAKEYYLKCSIDEYDTFLEAMDKNVDFILYKDMKEAKKHNLLLEEYQEIKTKKIDINDYKTYKRLKQKAEKNSFVYTINSEANPDKFIKLLDDAGYQTILYKSNSKINMDKIRVKNVKDFISFTPFLHTNAFSTNIPNISYPCKMKYLELPMINNPNINNVSLNIELGYDDKVSITNLLKYNGNINLYSKDTKNKFIISKKIEELTTEVTSLYYHSNTNSFKARSVRYGIYDKTLYGYLDNYVLNNSSIEIISSSFLKLEKIESLSKNLPNLKIVLGSSESYSNSFSPANIYGKKLEFVCFDHEKICIKEAKNIKYLILNEVNGKDDISIPKDCHIKNLYINKYFPIDFDCEKVYIKEDVFWSMYGCTELYEVQLKINNSWYILMAPKNIEFNVDAIEIFSSAEEIIFTEGIESIKFPRQLLYTYKIGRKNNSFYRSFGLGKCRKITFPSTLSDLKYSDYEGGLDANELKELHFKSLPNIDDKLFSKCNISSITSPNNSALKKIYNFSCINIVDFSDMTKIPEKYSMNNKALTTLKLNKNITEINNQAFYNCINLTKINNYDEYVLPISSVKLGENVFVGCPFKSILLLDGWKKNKHVLTEKNYGEIVISSKITLDDYLWLVNNAKVLRIYFKDESYNVSGFPCDCNSIDLVDNKMLLELDLHKSIRVVNNNFLSKLTKLKSMKLHDLILYAHKRRNLKYINEPELGSKSVFDSCSDIHNLSKIEKSKLTHIILKDNIKTLEQNTFKDCYNLSKLECEGDIISIGDGAFENTYSLEEFICSDKLKEIGTNAFKNSGISKFSMPESCTKLGIGAFEGCSKLSSVKLSSNLTELKERTFKDCINLNYIESLYQVSYVRKDAFESTMLSKIVLNAECIENFGKIEELEELIILSNPNYMELNFSNYGKLKKAILPKEVKENYSFGKVSGECFALNGSKWKSKLSGNVVYYNKTDFQNICQEYLRELVEGISLTNNDFVVPNITTKNIDDVAISLVKEEENIEDQSLEDVLVSVVENTMVSVVDRKYGNGSYDISSDMVFTYLPQTITSNIFTVDLELVNQCLSVNKTYYVLIDANGNSASNMLELTIGNDLKNVKLNFELKNNITSGKYYLVESTSNMIENNVSNKVKFTLDILFSNDDIFDF